MSFDDRLLHTLVVKKMVAGGTFDDYGQPITAETTLATVKGLIQPRSARELALTTNAGATIGEYVGYMRPLTGITTGCWIEYGGDRYDILTMPDAAGLGHHLELGLQKVTP